MKNHAFRYVLLFITIAMTSGYLKAQEVLYVSDGNNIYVDNSLAVTLSGGATIAADTLLVDDTLYARGGTFTGYYRLKRFVVDGGSTVTLDSSGSDVTEMMITQGVKVTGSSTLNAKGQLRLLSLASVTGVDSTARIEELASGNAIAGTVTIERYIPGGKRRFRYFSHPFNTAQSFANTVMDDIDVTGAGGSANGFTTTGTNTPSAWWFDPTLGTTTSVNNPGWQAFTSANASNWLRHMGMFMFIRGAQGEGLLNQTYTPSPVTIDMTGAVNQGNQTINLSTGVSGGGFNVVGNPYPSAVNLKTPVNNISNKKGSGFWLFNTNMSSGGAYEVYLYNTDCMLPSNSAFSVDVTANTSVTFQESYKTDTGRAVFKGTALSDIIEFRVYTDSIYWDRMFVVFDPAADAKYDNADAMKFTNGALDFYALTDDSVQVSINGLPFNDGKIVPLNFDTDVQDSFEIYVADYTVQSGYRVVLLDKYLNKTTLLQQGASYRFAVTADSMSAGARFQLGLSTLGVPTVARNSGVKIYPNPVSGKQVMIEWDGENGRNGYDIVVTDVFGRVVYTGTSTRPLANVDASAWAPGTYLVQLTNGSASHAEKVTKY
mgnify:CR=1 FL=1